MTTELVNAIVEMREDDVLRLVNEAVKAGKNPDDIVTDCRDALRIIGGRFKQSECSMAEIIMSGEMIKSISGILGIAIPEEPFLNTAKDVKAGGSEDSCSTCS